MKSLEGREAILARLAAVPAAAPTAWPARPEAVVAVPDEEPDALIERFVHALARAQGTWQIAASPVIARLTLATRLQEGGVKQVLSWAASELPVDGVLEALEVLGIEAITPAPPLSDTRLRPQDLEVRRRYLLGIEGIPVGLTGADAAFAATGTLALRHGPGRPLLVNQMPRRHIVLLAADQIYPTMECWLAQRPAAANQPHSTARSATLLTGPSRSADIEVTPVFGVHGPGKLHVIVVQGR